MNLRPITIERYGVALRRLERGDIEMVRRWRTDERIRRTMAFRGDISPEDQERWFASLDPERDYYFVLVVRGRPVGLVDVKRIDWKERSGEGGIFVHDERYQNSIVPYCALVNLLEFAFGELGLEAVTGHVLRDNPRAVRFAESMGYERLPGQEDVQNQIYRVTPAAFAEGVERIRPMLETFARAAGAPARGEGGT